MKNNIINLVSDIYGFSLSMPVRENHLYITTQCTWAFAIITPCVFLIKITTAPFQWWANYLLGIIILSLFMYGYYQVKTAGDMIKNGAPTLQVYSRLPVVRIISSVMIIAIVSIYVVKR